LDLKMRSAARRRVTLRNMGGQVSRSVAAMGLLLHPRHAGLAPMLVAGQRLFDGLVGGKQLGEYESVLQSSRAASAGLC
jgi:hypothetical protein